MKRSSYEIKNTRKQLMQFLSDNINDDTDENRKYFLVQLNNLQRDCNHVWDIGVDAIQPIGKGRSICQICGKQFNI